MNTVINQQNPPDFIEMSEECVKLNGLIVQHSTKINRAKLSLMDSNMNNEEITRVLSDEKEIISGLRKKRNNLKRKIQQRDRDRHLHLNMTPLQIERDRDRHLHLKMTPDQIERDRDRHLHSNLTPDQQEKHRGRAEKFTRVSQEWDLMNPCFK